MTALHGLGHRSFVGHDSGARAAADRQIHPYCRRHTPKLRHPCPRPRPRPLTRRWSFEQAVKYFMEAGGLDREAAEGEAAGAASNPHQKISYIVGKWQIMNLLGQYRDRQGETFSLGQFHDDLIKNGSLPVSIIEWIVLDDDTAVKKATEKS